MIAEISVPQRKIKYNKLYIIICVGIVYTNLVIIDLI